MFNWWKKNTQREKNILSINIISGNNDNCFFDEYIKKCEILGCNLQISIDSNSSDFDYEYAPNENPIDSNQFLEVVFTLMSTKYDYIIISNGLEDYPIISAEHINDSIIYNKRICKNIKNLIAKCTNFSGRIMRLPGYTNCDNTINFSDLFKGVSLDNEFIIKSKSNEIPNYNSFKINANYKKSKKMVFVMPIFMAVGGVEKNTIEIMRSLQDKYDFCVITMERHTKGQGSLNYQLDGLCVANYDLRELVDFNNYFDALEQLRDIYKPDVIWLCNNSPWLEANLLQFRNVFTNQRIVAQDVYDTQYGWVEYYSTEGIHSLDRYIAVNEKIKETFIKKHNIPEEKIRVIYSAINDAKIKNAIKNNISKEELCNKYGINPSSKHVALIGRMTEQKNPIRFLEIINNVHENYQNIEFLIIGDGTLSCEVDEYITLHNLSDCVKRIKFVDNTPELFRVLDGLVLTSIYEGLAIVSIEAMCMGVPVFSTDTGDLKLFIEKTKGGHIIEVGEEDSNSFMLWFNSIDEYASNAERYSTEILDFFSARNIGKQYCEIFDM